MPEMNSLFDPPSNDDFLDQMISNMAPQVQCSWPELNPKSLWDPNSVQINGTHLNSDETAPSDADNVGLQFDEHANLAAKFRNHQIAGNSPTPKSAALMLQQQLLMSRVLIDTAENFNSGMLPISSSLSGGDYEHTSNDVVDGPSFKSLDPGGSGEGSVGALYNGFAGSLNVPNQASNQTHHFQHPQGGQNYGGQGAATNQAPVNGATSQPKQRVRARRGQATDPHSIAERLRRERIAERMKALQELVPNANKTDKASMLDEIIDYVKFLRLQVKVLSMSRLGSAGAVAPLVAEMSSEGGGDCIQASANGGPLGRDSNGNQTASSPNNDSLTMTENQVAKLMEEDMGSAMQYLQGKGLCLMPISLATAISAATRSHPFNLSHNHNGQIQNSAANNIHRSNNGEVPSSPSMSVLTVQSATMGNAAGDSSVTDAASVSKP